MQNLIRTTFFDANKITSQYPVGQILNVYYNPDKPEESVVDTEKSGSLFGELASSLLALGIGLFVLYYALSL